MVLSVPAVFAAPPVAMPSAKSKWLECGGYTINLDEEKEKYSAKLASFLYQGKATFFPQQITFDILWLEAVNGGGEKKSFSINRKDLSFQIKNLSRTNLGRVGSLNTDTGWVQKGETQEGSCKVIKNPTEENKI